MPAEKIIWRKVLGSNIKSCTHAQQCHILFILENKKSVNVKNFSVYKCQYK